MIVGVLLLEVYLPASHSLKEKRSIIKPIIARLQREFNLTVAEVDALDKWQKAVIACAMISNDRDHIHRSLQHVENYVEENWPDITLLNQSIVFL